MIEVIRIGGIFDKEDKQNQAGGVYSTEGLCPTICTNGGGIIFP